MRDVQAARGTSVERRLGTALSWPVRFRAVWACVAVVGLTLDVVTKVIAVNQLEPGQPVGWSVACSPFG